MKHRFWTLSLSVLPILGALLVDCTASDTTLRRCTSALSCASFAEMPKLAHCAAGPNGDKSQYWLTNAHRSRRLRVTWVERTEHLDQTGAPDVVGVMQRRLDPLEQLELSCRYTQTGDRFAVWSYRLLSACYDDDPTCEESETPAGPAAQACMATCTGPDCIRREVTSQTPVEEYGALAAAAEEIRRALASDPPFPVNVSRLLALGSSCPVRSDATVDSTGVFRSTGSSCLVSLSTAPHPTVGVVQVALGPTITGSISGTATQKVLDLESPEDVQVHYFDLQGTSLGSEGVRRVVMTRSQLRIAGSRRFCIWLDVPDSSSINGTRSLTAVPVPPTAPP